MAVAEMEDILVVGDMDCVKGLRMVAVGLVGSPGCIDSVLDIPPAVVAGTEAADLVRS